MKALILSAGKGTRLGALTQNLPKVMLDMNGIPLLERQISYLASQGVLEIAVNLHYQKQLIENHLKRFKHPRVRIHISHEKNILGTAGALIPLKKYFSGENNFIVLYGDVITSENITDMISFHQKESAIATLLVHKNPNSNSFLSLDNHHRITHFWERPHEKEVKKYNLRSSEKWTNSGLQILNKEIFKYIPPNRECDLPRDIYTKIINQKKLCGYPLRSFRIAVDSPERYESATKWFKENN